MLRRHVEPLGYPKIDEIALAVARFRVSTTASASLAGPEPSPYTRSESLGHILLVRYYLQN